MAEEKPDWMKTKPADVEKLIVELAKSGQDPAKIGLTLRDKHGIPKVKLMERKITRVLEKEGIEFKQEKDFSKAKIENLQRHIAKNKHDHTSKRSLAKEMWKIRKLEAQ